MDEMMSPEEIKLVLKWIGTPNGKLTLLYSWEQAKGYQTQSYQRACYNKGKTITVALSQQGWLFGGYSAHPPEPDGEVFLFRLRSNQGKNPKVFKPSPIDCKVQTSRDYSYDYEFYPDIDSYATKGPAFAYAGQQCEFYIDGCYATVQPAGHLLQTSNQHSGYGNSYYGQPQLVKNASVDSSQTAQELMGHPSQTQLTSWRVFKVEDSKAKRGDAVQLKPWRKGLQHWTEKELDSVKQDVAAFRPPQDTQVEHVKVLMVGPIGAGKSSFFNTINSTFRGYVAPQAATGKSPHGITSKFRIYEVKTRSSHGGGSLNVRFCDTLGIANEQGIHVGDIAYLMDGNIPNQFQFNTLSPVTPDTAGFIGNPDWKDRVHIVALVLDAQLIEDLSDKISEKLIAIKTQAHARGIPLVVILTHIDAILEEPGDLSFVFRSQAVLAAVDGAADKMGVPRGHVLPVKNYESETELETHVDILALVALRQILRFADAYFDDQIDLKGFGKSNKKGARSHLAAVDKLDQPN